MIDKVIAPLDEHSSTRYLGQGGKPRTIVLSSETLPRHHVTNMSSIYTKDHHFLQQVLPVYSY